MMYFLLCMEELLFMVGVMYFVFCKYYYSLFLVLLFLVFLLVFLVVMICLGVVEGFVSLNGIEVCFFSNLYNFIIVWLMFIVICF